MKKYILLLITSTSLIFNSCIDKLGNTVEDFEVCKKRWITNKVDASIATAEIIDSKLLLQANNLKAGINLDLSQDTIYGDFEAIVKFSNFNLGITADSNSSFFEFYVNSINNNQLKAVANVSSNSTAGVFDDTVATKKSYNNVSTNLNGTLKISRTGSIVTVVTIVNSISPIDGSTVQNVSTSVKNNFGADKLMIGFKLGAEKNESKPINLNITEFSINNGGGKVISDAFNCNSLK